MLSLVQRLRHWLAAESTLYECRNCGITLEEQRDTCPHCGAEDIARYDLD
ncbi:Ribosomal L32p protein family protein [Haladaptatus litoreus]|uniref:Ribosomal L32p protein family protein n=1 Tax=Haladaptatus litoreus TaxID=553468 RepID=A0A1N7CXR8_9EURY|nr:50S ribosomal protein L32 [Haladaptatus litoreus]SIR68340.1 Ribosomal L32p protein family protein [Haladaptatus litoreus]